MKRPVRLAAVAAAGILALALSSCSGSAPAGEESAGGTTRIKVATIGVTTEGSLFLGIDQGFFAEEGLEVETSVVANAPAGLAAAQSGQVEIAYTPTIPLLNALSQGVPLKVVSAADGYPEQAAEHPEDFDSTGLFAAIGSDISSVADLKGKTIAVPARNAQLEVVVSDELRNAGVDPASQVEWVVLDFTSALSALQGGTVDAAALVNPFSTQAKDAGAHQLSAPSIGFFEGGTTAVWAAGSSTIEKKPEVVAAFQRAIAKANEYANQHPDEAIQAGIDATGSKLSVDQVKLPAWPVVMDVADLERTNRKMAELGFLKTPVELDGVVLEAK